MTLSISTMNSYWKWDLYGIKYIDLFKENGYLKNSKSLMIIVQLFINQASHNFSPFDFQCSGFPQFSLHLFLIILYSDSNYKLYFKIHFPRYLLLVFRKVLFCILDLCPAELLNSHISSGNLFINSLKYSMLLTHPQSTKFFLI